MRLVNIRDVSAVRQLYLTQEFGEALGQVLFSWRYNRLLTQSQAATIFQVHRTTYAAWEDSTIEIRVGTLIRIRSLGNFEAWQLGLGNDLLPPIGAPPTRARKKTHSILLAAPSLEETKKPTLLPSPDAPHEPTL